MTSRRNFLKQMGLATAGLVIGCSKDESGESSSSVIDVEFELPSMIEVSLGGTYSFKVLNGKAPLTTDTMLFADTSSGTLNTCAITESNSSSFTIQMSGSIATGTYTVYIRRGSERRDYGSTYVNIVDAIDGLVLNDNTTVYGLVSCGGEPLSGVLISDGVEFAQTDENGIYQLASKKASGYVFIIIPSGYEVESDGVLPVLWHCFVGATSDVERWDFPLTKASNQDKFKLLLLGDMHLAKRTNDLAQFADFTNDLNEYLAAHAGETIYAVALGDLAWDQYWYDNNYALPDYLNTINDAVKGLQIFHTMGNHDNDYLTYSDEEAEIPYIENIAPTYYSFNIGKVHIIVLDDIDCSDYDGTKDRNYTKNFVDKELEWLQKDLSYIDTSTPLLIFTHAQIYYPASTGFAYDAASTRTTNSERFLGIVQDYKPHIITGHSHKMFTVVPDDRIVAGRGVYEHNVGAICGTWWWSGYLTPGIHIGEEGCPGGYAVWDIEGEDIKWQFKATGRDINFQFRTYDLNNVKFSMDDVPNMNQNYSSLVNEWNKYVNTYPGSTANEVLINIWNWDSNWKLEVVDDNGNTLTATETWTYDPLHIEAYTKKRMNDASLSSVPSFTTLQWSHIFKVKASDATVGLNITVTDEFGNVYTEHMSRPKEFSVDAYKDQ